MMIPFRHRKLIFVAWAKVLVSYLVFIKEMLYLYWDQTQLDASITSQIMYIEKILNLACERTDIYISEGYYLGPWIVTAEETPDPEFYMDLYDSYVYTKRDAVDVDFIVNIPTGIESSIPVIAALAHKYKLPGKCFIIQKF